MDEDVKPKRFKGMENDRTFWRSASSNITESSTSSFCNKSTSMQDGVGESEYVYSVNDQSLTRKKRVDSDSVTDNKAPPSPLPKRFTTAFTGISALCDDAISQIDCGEEASGSDSSQSDAYLNDFDSAPSSPSFTYMTQPDSHRILRTLDDGILEAESLCNELR